jgi:hypothetical protein
MDRQMRRFIAPRSIAPPYREKDGGAIAHHHHFHLFCRNWRNGGAMVAQWRNKASNARLTHMNNIGDLYER